MKTTITMREYDTDGNMTRETVTEYETPASVAPAPVCVCGQPWHSTVPRYCPLHGTGYGWGITSTTPRTYTINSTVNSGGNDAQVGRQIVAQLARL